MAVFEDRCHVLDKPVRCFVSNLRISLQSRTLHTLDNVVDKVFFMAYLTHAFNERHALQPMGLTIQGRGRPVIVALKLGIT